MSDFVLRKLWNITRKAIRKVLIAGSFTFILFLIASSDGWGYQIVEFDVDPTSSVPLDPVKSAVPAHVKISLNPILFPINHICNGGLISSDLVFIVYTKRGTWFGENVGGMFQGGNSDPNSYTSSERAEAIASILVFSELGKNIPFYFFTGLFIAYLMSKLLERVRGEKSIEFPELGPEAELGDR